jgi:ferredoxin--NADP+ reductase
MPVPGVYAAGWVKRGPSGIIGTNKRCARETVERLLEDAANFRLPEPNGVPDELMTQVADRGTKIVTYDGWKAIDSYERGLGESQGRPRVKLIRRDEMLDHALGGPTKT